MSFVPSLVPNPFRGGLLPRIAAWWRCRRNPEQSTGAALANVREELRSAGADAWDSIDDPEAFVRELRGVDPADEAAWRVAELLDAATRNGSLLYADRLPVELSVALDEWRKAVAGTTEEHR